METNKGIEAFDAKTRSDWRNWLEKNHLTSTGIWLVIYHKNSGKQVVDYEIAIQESLCFGWIDSLANKRDAESSYLMFTPRKPKGKWSGVNKKRVELVTALGLMMPEGQRMIDLAKATGTWEALEGPEKLIVPDDLQKLLDQNETALKHYLAFAPSARRTILQWVSDAKRPETRQKRIEKVVELAAQNIKAAQ